MRARFWGSRGSLASPGPETVRTGGNTSCIEVRPEDGSLVILDSGTGIRALGLSLDGSVPKRIDILLSHLHLDHLVGLGFFAPLWNPEVELHDAPEQPFTLGSATITARPIIHRGPTVGYRIEDGGHTLAYLTDHEPALAVDLSKVEPEWVSGFEVAAGADVLIHDCQYTEDEYPDRAGFGHSSTQHVADFARLAGAKRLLLFHHDPNHTDDELEALCARVAELWDGGTVDLAREGDEIAFG